MASVPITPRPLNSSERAVLEHILSVGFDGSSVLRGQLDHVEVVATWGAGSLSIDLCVREPIQQAPLPTRLVPVNAQVLDPSGQYVGELLVWLENGAVLAGLEYAWVTDEPPMHLPAIENIHLAAAPSQSGMAALDPMDIPRLVFGHPVSAREIHQAVIDGISGADRPDGS